jgi:hypothetical protein
VQANVRWSLHFLPLQMMNCALQICTEQLFKFQFSNELGAFGEGVTIKGIRVAVRICPNLFFENFRSSNYA